MVTLEEVLDKYQQKDFECIFDSGASYFLILVGKAPNHEYIKISLKVNKLIFDKC